MNEPPLVAEEMHVRLTAQAAAARDTAAARAGMTRTDLVNRALVLYDAVDKALGVGSDVLINAGLPSRRRRLRRQLRSRRLTILNIAVWRGAEDGDSPG